MSPFQRFRNLCYPSLLLTALCLASCNSEPKVVEQEAIQSPHPIQKDTKLEPWPPIKEDVPPSNFVSISNTEKTVFKFPGIKQIDSYYFLLIEIYVYPLDDKVQYSESYYLEDRYLGTSTAPLFGEGDSLRTKEDLLEQLICYVPFEDRFSDYERPNGKAQKKVAYIDRLTVEPEHLFEPGSKTLRLGLIGDNDRDVNIFFALSPDGCIQERFSTSGYSDIRFSKVDSTVFTGFIRERDEIVYGSQNDYQYNYYPATDSLAFIQPDIQKLGFSSVAFDTLQLYDTQEKAMNSQADHQKWQMIIFPDTPIEIDTFYRRTNIIRVLYEDKAGFINANELTDTRIRKDIAG
ncbi:MAG: hypothetical protein AAFN81_09070 [Bacteroidota bacterium]